MKSKLSIVFILVYLVAIFPALASDETKFLEAGMPSTDHTWLGDDYARAAEVLSVGRIEIPLYSDPAGRVFLKRVTATENLSFYRSHTMPLQYRIEDYIKTVKALDTFLLLYIAAANKGIEAHRETAEITAFMVSLSSLGVGLTDEFIPTLAKDNQYFAKMQAVNNLRYSAAGIFAGAEGSLSRTDFYSREDLSIILKAMTSALPQVKKILPADYQRGLRDKLAAQKSHFGGEDLRNLEKMIGLLGYI